MAIDPERNRYIQRDFIPINENEKKSSSSSFIPQAVQIIFNGQSKVSKQPKSINQSISLVKKMTPAMEKSSRQLFLLIETSEEYKSDKPLSLLQESSKLFMKSQNSIPVSLKDPVASKILDGWDYSGLSSEHVTKSEDGRFGVYFITGNQGKDLVVKAKFNPTSTAFSTHFLSAFGIDTPKTHIVSNPDEVKSLCQLTGIVDKRRDNFLLMEKVIGTNLSALEPDEADTVCQIDKYFHTIGKLAMFDAFICNNPDRISLSGSGGVQSNAQNIMVNTNTAKVYAIDNDSDLHQKASSGQSMKELLDQKNHLYLLSIFIGYLPAFKFKKKLPEKLLPYFQSGIEESKKELKKAFTSKSYFRKRKVDEKKIRKFVEQFIEKFPFAERYKLTLIESLIKKSSLLI